MLVITIQLNLIVVYLCWQILKEYKPSMSVSENLYIRCSDLCRTLTTFQPSSIEDDHLLQNAVKIIHYNNEIATWYPITKYVIAKDDVVTKWYFVQLKPLYENNTHLYPNSSVTVDLDDNIFTWFPITESFVQLDRNGTKWIPLKKSVVRRKSGPFSTNDAYLADESLLKFANNMFQWFSMNGTLLRYNINVTSRNEDKMFTQLRDDDEVNWYPINDSMVELDDSMVQWSPINIPRGQLSSSLHKWFPSEANINWLSINDTHIALKRPAINVTKRTKLIIPGFKASVLHDVTSNISRAYYHTNKFNVLLLEAKRIFDKNYFKCVNNAQILGKAIAELIINLERFGANGADFHILGVSLGAHAAGWVGKYYKYLTGKKIGRITGLDPAGPCFTYTDKAHRLDKSDALYVDVIHTNAYFQGMFEAIGHADFYLNGGGPSQPGCLMPTCSHLRAAFVFCESIKRPQLFVGLQCDSWENFIQNKCNNVTALLGEGSSSLSRGKYYLRTSNVPPYGLGKV